MAQKLRISLGLTNFFFPLLGLIFITLKLTGYIAWSWLWVLAPIWGPIAIAAIIAVIFLLGLGCACLFLAVIDALVKKKKGIK